MEINGYTRLIGLVGNPVGHTLSPVIHNNISECMGIPSVYVPFQVETEGLQVAVKGAYELNVLGMNVTVPYKNDVMNAIVAIDDAAEAIGAVNTLVRDEELHGYKGYNTDMLGLQRQIREDGVSLQDETVVILGAGGAAKAVVYMCLLEGAKRVYLLNRTLQKAEEIAKSMNETFATDAVVPMELQKYMQIEEDRVIAFQATSIGLSPNVDQVVLTEEAFYKKVMVGVDLIYNPAETRFMQLVKRAGGKAYNALKMLLYQAVIAYELWHDVEVPQDIINEVYVVLKRRVYKKDNIVLVGFMGSGKTTFGKACAKALSMEFLDADEYIVERAGKTIPEIFSEDGEDAFRKLETEILQEFSMNLSNTVLSTGGGMPLRKENANLLREIGRVGYLTATPKEIYDRVKGDTNRPLLQCENPYEKICDMMRQRKPFYEGVADVIIDTNCNDIDAIVEDMKNYLLL